MNGAARRKSSFFCRELQHSVIGDSSPVRNTTETSLEEQVILDHISETEKEISEWNTYYRQVKSKRQELEKYENDLNIIQWDECKDDLLEEDIEFLRARPDYKSLTSKLNDLVNKVEITKKQTSMIKSKVNHNVDVMNRAVQHTKQNICNYLLNTDETEHLFGSND